MLRTPIAAMNCQASRTFFWAFFRSAGSAARAAPDAAAQLAAEDESSCGAAASIGGVHAGWARATAPTAAHMSPLLGPAGNAQPHGFPPAPGLFWAPGGHAPWRLC